MRTIVLVPVFNEMENLRSFYNDLRKFYSGEVLFVNDGSNDGSFEFLKKISSFDENIFLFSNEERAGYGYSLIKGFNFAIKENYDSVITIDSDLQHRPEYIKNFIEKLKIFDVVLGSRYINFTNIFDVPKDRFLINRYIMNLLRIKFGYHFSDPFCGFRGYRREFLEKTKLSEKSYGIALEILLEIIYKNVKYIEIPVDLIYDKNKKREFLEGLNDPKKRLLYYLEVIERKKRHYNEEDTVCGTSSR